MVRDAGTVRNTSAIDLKGIPEGATVSLKETNSSPDSYKVSAGTTSGGVDLLAETTVASGRPSGATETQTLSTNTKSIYLTNKLDAISPTNVVMRFAPFLFIFGAAILLLVVMRRRRTHDAE